MKFLDSIRDIWRKEVRINGSTSIRNTPMIQDIISNKGEFFNINEVSLWVNRGIQKRSQKVGQIEFKLYKNDEEIESHPILDLLDRPNERQTGDMFWALASEYKDISGFAVIRMVGNEDSIFRPTLDNVKSLELMNSSNVVINYSMTGGDIESFTETKHNGDIQTTPFNQCIYWIKPDPKNPYEGMSLLKAGLYSIDTDNQLTRYQNAIVKNGGTTDTIMSFKNPPNVSTVNEMRELYKKERRNPTDADIPYFIGGEAKIERLGMTPAELAYLESRKLLARDMSVITGVPMSILAYSGDTTFANADQDYKNFLRETIKPICDDIVNLLNWKLVPAEYELEYEDPSPEDVDNKIKIINALYNTDASTINERREILGLDRIELPEADEIMVSYSKTPLGYKEPTVAEQLPTDTTTDETTKSKGMNHIHYLLRDKGFRDMYRKVAKKKSEKNESIFVAMIRDYFVDQEARIIEDLNNTKALVDDVLNEQLEIKIASEKALPLLRRFLEQAGVEAIGLLDSNVEFDMSANIKRWLTNRSKLFAKEITATTYEKLKNQFAESATLGENRQQLIERVQSVYEGFDENRAKTIARTETHGSMQKGGFEGSKQAGAEIKIWVSVLDGDTRGNDPKDEADHLRLDGEEVAIDKKFSNGLMFAGDPSGSPEETINCRCSTV